MDLVDLTPAHSAVDGDDSLASKKRPVSETIGFSSYNNRFYDGFRTASWPNGDITPEKPTTPISWIL